ncbi:MarR family winged helix-turn-helix transcriptional regulator [Acetobacter estunensis]|uniref:MarR family winged helix-turn-helix transcriptional regulator n=1 Tax=Acetobacter estunensis TaxID=104097 RepID=UPI001C2D5F33|nr:MarR family transcriptional regulator [Acetobacter estunensis]MBV1837992.1 MarR family transcriptional regulator [Acetobacter estunensis]
MNGFGRGQSDIGAGADVLFLREQEIRGAQQLMVLAWLDLGRTIAPLLEEMELGAAQYRALQMLALLPGLTVGELQSVLGVAKQSLARTLNELHVRGLVASEPGRQDRRQRFLSLTETGQAMEARLFAAQRELMVGAYREAGSGAVRGFRQVLRGMLSEHSRDLLARNVEMRAQVGQKQVGRRMRDGR